VNVIVAAPSNVNLATSPEATDSAGLPTSDPFLYSSNRNRIVFGAVASDTSANMRTGTTKDRFNLTSASLHQEQHQQ
jgi:hypothetical protein